jgi:ribonuclease HI
MSNSVKLIAYTDGSCQPNPGPGGWGYILHEHCKDGFIVETISKGYENKTTNNRMELMAVVSLLDQVSKFGAGSVKIYSDSMYVINCAKGVWSRKKNVDLWKLYDDVVSGVRVSIEYEWVKGHSGDPMNERVDKLAKSAVVK